jgi:GAF domain-containing protein
MASVVHRSGDLAARYGGEEFVLILPVTEATAAEKVANALRAAIATLKLPHAGNASCGGFVTASLGVSTAYPQAGGPQTKWLDLIAEADALLYEAKRTGRNRVASPANIGHRGTPPLLENEAHRLAALAMYERAGATKRTAELSRIAQLAAKLMSSPIGLVSLVGRDEQRFAGSFGLQDVDGTGRDISFCAHTILQDDPFVVPDATRDIRFDENALVTGDFGLRYYAGAPIICETTGHRLGTVCVVDKTARAETSPAQRTLLTELAKMTAAILKEQLNSNSQHEVVESLNW